MFLDSFHIYINKQAAVVNPIIYNAYLLSYPISDTSFSTTLECSKFLLNTKFMEFKKYKEYINLYLEYQTNNSYTDNKRKVNKLLHLMLHYNIVDPMSAALFIQYYNNFDIPKIPDSYMSVVSLINSYINYSSFNLSDNYNQLSPHLDMYHHFLYSLYRFYWPYLKTFNSFKYGLPCPILDKRRNNTYVHPYFTSELCQTILYSLEYKQLFDTVKKEMVSHFLMPVKKDSKLYYTFTYPFISHFLLTADRSLIKHINLVKLTQNIKIE